MVELGEKLSLYRQNKNLTQEELATRLGVTAQAVSKWERKQSYPDVAILPKLCQILEISADLLLETECSNFSEDNDWKVSDEILKELRDCEEPLSIRIGIGLVDVFRGTDKNAPSFYAKLIEQQRKNLAWEGILMPIVRIRDDIALDEKEWMIVAYHRVLFRERLEETTDQTCQYMAEVLGKTVRKHYGYILNRDLVRIITENLKKAYPALIMGVVPEKISYQRLQNVMAGLLERGDSLCYMVKTIETIENSLQKNPALSDEDLVQAVADEIEREDNFWRVMAK